MTKGEEEMGLRQEISRKEAVHRLPGIITPLGLSSQRKPQTLPGWRMNSHGKDSRILRVQGFEQENSCIHLNPGPLEPLNPVVRRLAMSILYHELRAIEPSKAIGS